MALTGQALPSPSGASALLRFLRSNRIALNPGFQREMLRLTLQTLMEWEVSTRINAGHYERVGSRKTYRNGYRPSSLRSSLGDIPLYIPKLRSGTYSPEFTRQAERAILKLSPEAFLGRLDPHDLIALCHTLGLAPLSLSEAHRLLTLLTTLADRWRAAPLDADFHEVWLDEVEYSAYRTLYVAVGVTKHDQVELIGFEDSAETSWAQFLLHLHQRGLRDVQTIISEANMHILNAIGTLLPDAEWQMNRLADRGRLLDTDRDTDADTDTRQLPSAVHGAFLHSPFERWAEYEWHGLWLMDAEDEYPHPHEGFAAVITG
jgi:transposase-like protein